MPPRELRHFLHLHAGQTAWLFGKGPSLDRFDFEAAGPLRLAINDVVGRVPGCRYGFANDGVAPWAHVYRPGMVLFQPRRLEHDLHAARCPVACERVVFDDDWEDDRLGWPPERLAREGLCVRRGTLGSAGQILRIMGVARVVCVGIDGGGRHASGVWHTRLRANHAEDYNAIRDAFILASHIGGLAVEFFGSEPGINPNGMKTIKIIENTLLRGRHLCAGEVIAASPAEAENLVAVGRAVWWSAPPPPPAPESAVLQPPPAEHAALQRRLRGRSRVPAALAS